ncbi:hypothetical protein DM02DRAFT_605517 [Periconia macrospinosa]|uniref:C2H2-type domain-containing protein n=1 Tax=Periconia macrospinosa TaxID=97972 RepID=A0A2V1D2Q8_9PLEO|nr:hypothetical protein DM02DRAFT_605517 [Periconia macrospinosa]
MTLDGERRIPFSIYTRSHSTCAPDAEHGRASFGFNRLPAELQLRILASCPPSTLFQLMHVSSTLRAEASKRFRAEPSAYFLVEAWWLLDGAHPGKTSCDMAFLAHVENIEVEYQPSLTTEICPRRNDVLTIRQDLIRAFWNSLTRIFPEVKKVILNHNGECITWPDGPGPLPLALQLLLRACPRHVDASTLMLDKGDPARGSGTVGMPLERWRRSVYRLGEDGLWKRSEPDKVRMTVMMPVKRFIGPVGEFQKLYYDFTENILLQKYELWPLMVEALDRHHFDGGNREPFSCPIPECHAYLEKPGAWTIHVAEMHFQERKRLVEALPCALKVGFKNRMHALEAKAKEIDAQYKRIGDEWNEKDGLRRRDMERSWMEQLENDEAWSTGNAARESPLWTEFPKQVYVGEGCT